TAPTPPAPPPQLADLPAFTGDALDPAVSGGDLCVQSCADDPQTEQERVIGRGKGSGSPPGRNDEFDPLDLTAKGSDGELLIDSTAHVRLAHSSHNNGAVLLRRGYSFTDGTDSLGRLDAGLFFIAYQRDPRTQFVTIQTSLAGKSNDALNEYIQHVGSGPFACPSGVRPGQYWGQRLFEQA
ncbi:Dyp-type peroxidase, partial [Frankia tisae]